jgi:hypothetical protein
MPNDRLDRALNDVPADPSPADDNADNAPDPSAPPGGNQDGKGDGGDQSGRTIDNVRGELVRKLEQRDAALESLRAEINQLRSEISNRPTPQSDPANRTIDQMSLVELRTFRSQLPDETPAADLRKLDDYIIERTAEEKARDIYRNESGRERFRREEIAANQKAMERWPELRKRGGPFFERVNQILREMGDVADNNPQAVLHAANEAGFDLGMKPADAIRDQRPSGRRPTNVAGDSNSPADSGDSVAMSDEQIKNLSQRLAGALPQGKKFDAESIKKRDKYYQDNSHLYFGSKRGSE